MKFKKSLPPGSLIFTGDNKTNTTIKTISYNSSEVKISNNIANNKKSINWTIITGLSDTSYISKLCTENSIDLLVTEDILNVSQRSKIEIKEEYIFTVLKTSYIENDIIIHDYISILIFKDKLFTFHEYNSKIFDSLINRIEKNKGIIRNMNHDYLYYSILDLIVDNNMDVFNKIVNQNEVLEESILNLENANQFILHNGRKELLYIRNNISFFKDVFSKKFFESSELINNNIDKYFIDLHDHISKLNQDINTERELISNLLTIQMNNLSNKMNEIMKTLTIFSAVFIPLSFLTGFFGMNFVSFSALEIKNGIIYFMILCLSVAIAMILFFKKRNWF